MNFFRFFLVFTLAWAVARSSSAADTSQHGAVATVHPLATEAAVSVLKRGGNAIDATIAAGLTLGVVDGQNSGIGGGCFILIRTAQGKFIAIDGRETAPVAATRDMYLRDGKADPKLSQTGPLAVAVPGALAAYFYASTNFGKLPMRDHLLEAAKIAANGFVISTSYAARLKSAVSELNQFPAARTIFLRPDGSARMPGDLLKQSDLAASYRAIAEDGPRWFYERTFPQLTERWMKQNGGLLTADDFRRYTPKIREPLTTTYRGYTIVGFPPPSSGGVHVAQILNILEHFDLRALGKDSPEFVHIVAEAMKLAFADRAHWLGDPDFAPVPRGLAAKEYAATLAKRIDRERTAIVPQHSSPPNATTDVFGKHTTHFSVADVEGNWVACTATINTTFGSKVVVPGTGIVLNNEMDDFASQPGVTNYFGLLGAEANAIAPGKRPLSSMSPTIVLKDGKPVFSVGGAGGPTIISQAVLAIVLAIDFGLEPQAILAQPRFHHQWQPDELRVERRIGESVILELTRRGHRVNTVDVIGASQAMAWKDGGFSAASDPRVEGKATVW